MPGQKSNARQVSSLGESPAEARRRMQSSGGAAIAETAAAPAATGPPGPRHVAAMREQEGFGGGPGDDGTVEDAPELTKPPTPEKAMAMIRQLGQEKLQLLTERDSALQLVERYKSAFGELD